MTQEELPSLTFFLRGFTCESFNHFQVTASEDICIVKDGTYRKLIIKNCTEDDAGKYRCEADGRKTEAALSVEGIITGINLRHSA